MESIQDRISNNSIVSARTIQVIQVEIKQGTGKEHDPYRRVTQYWTLNGALLAIHDPEIDGFTPLLEDSDL